MSAPSSPLDGLPPAVEIRAGGQSLLVRRLGEGPRVVLLHGGPGLDHHLMLPLGLALAPAFQVWLPDLPGHGGSHPAGAPLPDLDQLIERTSRWLAGLERTPWVLGGHSLGAWLAREIVRRGRLAPRALVLISPPVPQPVRRAPPPPPRQPAGALALREELLEFATADLPAGPSPLFVASIARARLAPPANYVALSGQLRRALAAPLAPCRTGCPALVISGEADRIAPVDGVARVAEATNATHEIIEQVGHFPFAAPSDDAARVVREFLEGIGLFRTGNAKG